MRLSTTSGSARVEVSPMVSISSVAILRRIRRMILPERVFGSAGAQWMTSGMAIGPITVLTWARRMVFNSSEYSSPMFRVT